MTLTPNKKSVSILAIVIIILFLGSLLVNSLSKTAGVSTNVASTTRDIGILDSMDEMLVYSEQESAAPYAGSVDDAYDAATEEQYVIKTGSLELIVENITTAADELSAIASAYGGTVTDRYIYSRGDYTYGTVDLTVTEDNFDAAMSSIKEVAQSVTSENVNADDVTEQVIDIQARLENAQAEEAAYVTILAQATTVEDILNVQYYLSNVREEIERYQAQIEYYQAHTSYSTISVSLEEATSIALDSDEFQPWQTVKNSVQAVVRLFQGFILGLIEFIIVGGAILVPVVILFFVGRAIYRRYKK